MQSQPSLMYSYPLIMAIWLLAVLSIAPGGIAFAPLPIRKIPSANPAVTPSKSRVQPSTTSMDALLELPRHFFAISLPLLGILSTFSNQFNRRRLEEQAWEQRVEEAREERLREDPTVTELDLMRQEAAMEWSAYGPSRIEDERREAEAASGRKRVKVMERDPYDDEEEDNRRLFHMSDREIETFELQYGIEYDPYYDDPYSEDELPNDIKYKVDKRYGDRIYENGEIFYKDKQSGLFFRQGAKPRNFSFFN